jgi:hypothetical protein
MAEVVTWREVLDCFSDRTSPIATIDRLANGWANRFKIPHPRLIGIAPVQRETWTAEEVGAHLDRIAVIEPRIITDQLPRRHSGPLVIVDFGQGRVGQIDGRRRANVWRHEPGSYEVLRICVS